MKLSPLTKTALGVILFVTLLSGVLLYVAPGSAPGYLLGTHRDTLAIYGAAGTLATLVALLIALHQAHAALDVSRQVKHAVEETLTSYRAAFSTYSAGAAKKLLRDTELNIQASQWNEAASRADDTAEMLITLMRARPKLDDDLEGIVGDVRKWADAFRRQPPGARLSRPRERKWRDVSLRLVKKLDSLTHPVGVPQRGQRE